jgi:signal transduction histidine kinase
MIVAYFISFQIARMLERSYKHEKELESQVLQQEKLVTMGLLTAGMAHELNTPIANALVYTQILIEEMSNRQVSSESLEKLQTIEEEIHQISRIVRNLLEFSRPQKGEEHTDVAALLDRLLEIAKINETYPKMNIVVDHQNNLPPPTQSEHFETGFGKPHCQCAGRHAGRRDASDIHTIRQGI